MKTTVSMALCAALALALPANARADDARAFQDDAKRLASLHSFRMQLDANTPGTGRSSELLTYVEPDSLRVDIPSKHFSAVIIGSYLWLRGRSGHWKRAQLTDASDALAAVRASSRIAERARSENVRFAGTRTLDGRAMHVYEIVDRPRDGAPPHTERIWIGTSDGYPYRIDERHGDFTSTATYSSFNQLFSVSQ